MLWFDCEFILRVSQREGLPERVDIVSLAVAVERWSLQRPPIMMIDVLSSLLSTSSPARHPNTERVEGSERGREGGNPYDGELPMSGAASRRTPTRDGPLLFSLSLLWRRSCAAPRRRRGLLSPRRRQSEQVFLNCILFSARF